PRSLEPIREALYECMWSDVGILRTAEGLERALGELDVLDAKLAASGVAGADRTFNLTWQDWMNLRNLVAVSRVVTQSALAREDSRGAHFREDFPETGDLATSACIVARQTAGGLELSRQPVAFSRVRPGMTILEPLPA
ncbi:MAG: succinate dehydrogenase/fumarate reductase flavoprotein subunit, partial [Caldimonas sp.]